MDKDFSHDLNDTDDNKVLSENEVKLMFPLDHYLENIEIEVDLKKKFQNEKIEFEGATEDNLKTLEVIREDEVEERKIEKIASVKSSRRVFENRVMKPPYFCILVDEKTFIKGLTLFKSLCKKQQHLHVWVVCIDAISYSVLCRMKLDKCTPVHVSELGGYDYLETERQASGGRYYNRLQNLALGYIPKKYSINDLQLCEPEIYYFSDVLKGIKITEPVDVVDNDEFLMKSGEEQIYLAGEKVDAFRFTGFQIYNDEEFDLWNSGRLPENSNMLKYIYLPYLRALCETIAEIKERGMLKTEVFYSNEEKKNAGNYYSFKGGVI